MKENDVDLDLGSLCRCCDFHTYKLPDIEGLSSRQREIIEAICQLCVEHCTRTTTRASD